MTGIPACPFRAGVKETGMFGLTSQYHLAVAGGFWMPKWALRFEQAISLSTRGPTRYRELVLTS